MHVYRIKTSPVNTNSFHGCQRLCLCASIKYVQCVFYTWHECVCMCVALPLEIIQLLSDNSPCQCIGVIMLIHHHVFSSMAALKLFALCVLCVSNCALMCSKYSIAIVRIRHVQSIQNFL